MVQRRRRAGDLRRALKLIALTAAAVTLAGCTADRTIEIVNIDDRSDSPDYSVTSARLEQGDSHTRLILDLDIADPSASIELSSRVELDTSYVLWCEGEPRRPPSAASSSTRTLECKGDVDWPSDPRDARATIYLGN